jgi:16S rRNA (uracil1498-N3)-methyltransferase
MKRFILPSPPDARGEICLSGKDFHYLARVRRLKTGAELNALLSSGEEVRLRIKSIGRDSLIGECAAIPTEAPGAAIPPIVLFQALPKGAKMDLIVRQAAEGGIGEIRPFVSGHSVPKPGGERDEGRTKRWRRIIREARQQSGSPVDTKVSPPCDTEALLAYWEELRTHSQRPVGILLHQDPAGPLAQGSLHSYLSNTPDLVVFAIGPEGGFSSPEVSRFLEAGFKTLVIGNTVLRTETAALYAAAAIRIILLENPWWIPAAPDK